MISEATKDDVPSLVELCARFHAWSQFPGGSVFDPESCRSSFEALIERDNGVLLHGGGGFIGLSLGPLFFNHAEPMAVELFFWAPEGNGDAIRKAAEAWAKSKGALLLMMCGHEPSERASKWYSRKGYEPFGRQFMKVV